MTSEFLIEPRTLTGRFVTLSPMTLDDAPDLLAAAQHPETFRYFTFPPRTWDAGSMRDYCARLIDDPTIVPHTVRGRDNAVIGSTTYCSIRPAHRGVEIGWTWYAPSARGTAVNPECKLLLLERAFESNLFESGGAIRVELKTDSRNRASRAAISKLGAHFEGELRHHVIMSDGYLRDSAVYSIIPEQWPLVRAGLEQRLARFE